MKETLIDSKANEGNESNEIINNSFLIGDISKSQESQSNNDENIYAVYINNQKLKDINEKNRIDTSKYKLYNFLAKILMEQFSRLANIYFLIIAVLQSVKELSYSGGNPIILLPLSFVIILNGLKDLYEDYKRKKSDSKENNSECYIYHQINGFERKKWLDIKLGDIIKVHNNQQFPADLLLLSTSDENGICYVETKNLDGETNLKFRQANQSLHKRIYSKEERDISYLRYVCITKPPNEFIYKFDATLYETTTNGDIIDRKQFELFSNKSFLLRGCTLRQTDYIIGVAIYIGPHTKSMINSPDLKTKHSSVEAEMNRQLIAIFIIQILLALFCAIIYCIFSKNNFFGLRKYYFLDRKPDQGGFIAIILKMTGTWIIICTNFVPISLLVTMESIKLFQGMFIEWDIDMYDKETATGCKVQSSTLNEELGQVMYVFTDKTGTLTKNYMKYKMMSIGENIYGSFEGQYNTQSTLNSENIRTDSTDSSFSNKIELNDKYGIIPNVEFIDENNQFQLDRNNEDKKDLINEFMLCLSLCNSVLIDNKKMTEEKIIDYQASSPDEKAFVCFARSQGYILKNRSLDDIITLEINGEEKYFKLLNTLDYSSERKRMSVIIKTPSNRYMVYTKGADSMIEKLLCADEKSSNLLNTTNNFLKDFAKKGLRTLMIGYKEISEDSYKKWEDKYKKVKSNANHTEEDINNIYDEMENNFRLLGSTAVEDELQDKVDEIINYMMQTGMRVWMLTGDKMDTAKNVAISCKLFQDNMKIFEIREHLSNEELDKELRSKLNDKDLYDYNINFGLLISSEELEIIFSDNRLLKLFFDLSICCLTVVCSRISPKQKGQLVNLIKQTEKAITLAIGDGANDVGMITEANVGIGIQGKEGTQAARASDYAIKDFSCLKKLLFFHGRESYRKNSWVILYNFYKNVLFVAPMIWSGFITLFSGITIYDPIIHQLLNVVYTSAPPVMFGVFNYEYKKKELMRNPRYYIQGIYYKCFHMIRFFKFFAMGFLEGLIIFILAHYWYCVNNYNGSTNDFYAVGTIIMAGVVTIANLKVFLDMSFVDYYSLGFIIFSVFCYFLSVIIFSKNYILSAEVIHNFLVLDNFANVILDLKFFFYMILVCSFCYILEIFVKKAPILYGFVIEGKFLQPYHKKRNNSSYSDFEILGKEELDTYYSISMAKENQKKEEEEEDILLK